MQPAIGGTVRATDAAHCIYIALFYSHIYWFYISEMWISVKKKVYYMSLETEVTKVFLVSLQLLCFYGDLREKKTIKRMRYVYKIGKKWST